MKKFLLFLLVTVILATVCISCSYQNNSTTSDTSGDTLLDITVGTSTDSSSDTSVDTLIDSSGNTTDTDFSNISGVDHTHSYGDWQITLNAGCEKAGERQRSCACGDIETEAIQATGHNHQATVIQPDKTNKGYTEYKCDCGDTYFDNYTDALGSQGLLYAVNTDGTTCSIIDIGTCYDSNIIVPGTIDGYTVTKIDRGAFNYSSYIISVILPDTVTEIGDEAFYYCKGLKSITLGTGIEIIGSKAFKDCSSLIEIINHSQLPLEIGSEGYGYIANYALEIHKDESKLTQPINNFQFYTLNRVNYLVSYSGFDTKLILPDSYNGECYEICKGAFEGSPLISITIPSNVTGIGENAFLNCESLIEVINKSSLQITAGSEELGCVALYAIEVHSGESRISVIDDYIFYSLDDNSYLVKYTGYDEELTLPESCNGKSYDIYTNAFYLSTLLKKITIPNGVTKIGDGAFELCMSLTEVILPDTLIEIGNEAFNNTAISSIKLPDSLKKIGEDAFSSSKLTSIVIPDNVEAIENDTFRFCENLAAVDLGTGIKVIGKSAFEGCKELKEITIPDSVTELDTSAFSSCTNLAYVKLSKNITSLTTFIFSSCSSLEEIELHEGITEIGIGAFNGCSSLKSIDIPSSVTKIGSKAFQNCTSLDNVTVSDNVTQMGDDAFRECTSLKSISLGNGISSIGLSTFLGCTALEEIIIPDSVITVYSWAFYGCNSLKTVVIPKGMISIFSDAFENCSNFDIYYYGSQADFEKEKFSTLSKTHQIYFYSETEMPEAGNYWHYEENKPTLWA